MLTFVKTCFNILRNISFAVVLAIVGCFTWIWTDEELKQELVDTYDTYNQEIVIAEKTEQKETENLGEERNDDFIFEEEEEIFGIEAIEESSPREKSKKIKFEVKGGIAYLRPSQIMYMLSGSPLELTKIDEGKIYPKHTLTDILDKLERCYEEYFFRVKPAIINCNYVEQLIRENKMPPDKKKYSYQYVVVMQNGERIDISDTKAKELIEILDELSI